MLDRSVAADGSSQSLMGPKHDGPHFHHTKSQQLDWEIPFSTLGRVQALRRFLVSLNKPVFLVVAPHESLQKGPLFCLPHKRPKLIRNRSLQLPPPSFSKQWIDHLIKFPSTQDVLCWCLLQELVPSS